MKNNVRRPYRSESGATASAMMRYAALSAVAPLSCRKQTAQHVLATIGGSNGETPDGTWRGSTEWRGSIAGVRCVLHVLGFDCLRRLYHSHGVGLSSAPKSAVTVLVGGGWAGPGRYSLSAAQNSEPEITSNVTLQRPVRRENNRKAIFPATSRTWTARGRVRFHSVVFC